VRRFFKEKQKVWAEIDDAGAYILTDGLVNTRYTQDDDARVYRVAPANLAHIPDPDPKAAPQAASKAAAVAQLDLFGAPLPTATPPPAPTPALTHAPPAHQAPAPQPAPSKVTAPIAKLAAALHEADDYDGEGVVESLEVPESLRDIDPPPEGVIEIHTDGACQGNPGPCGYGVVIRHGAVYRELREFLGHGTNNIAELTAIEAALDALPPTDIPIRVHSDSAYAIGVLTQNWKPKANTELIARIKRRMRSFGKLTFHKVKGHSGLPLNERVDRLAVLSIEENI
jgi:ribonuclease HI